MALNRRTGTWAIAYADATTSGYKFAEQRDRRWLFSTVDKTSAGGGFISLAFDSAGLPAFTYYDAGNADLKFARSNGTSWQTETLAWKNVQGQYSNLSFLPNGQADVVYYHKTANGVFNLTGDFGRWQTTQNFLGGGQRLAAAYDALGNRAMAWVDTATGLLLAANSLAAPSHLVTASSGGVQLQWADHMLRKRRLSSNAPRMA